MSTDNDAPDDSPAGDDATSDDITGNDPSGNHPAGNHPAGNNPAGNDPSGNDPSGNNPAGNDPSGNEIPGEGASGDGATDGGAHRIARKLPSSLSVYHEFVQDILEKLQELGWSKELLFGIHMALEESISNAIRHGNKEHPQKLVHVECELSATCFWAKVCDEGEGYEPDAVPDCRSPENLEVAGGRGLALIRAYMTSVEHSECGCCVIMEKRLEAE